MPVRLVRIDSEENIVKKITIPNGTHLLGRGQLLQVFDLRVSRKHTEIEVKQDSVILKSLHHNPTFFIKNGSNKSELLHLDSTVALTNGDKVGLLPKEFWFELIIVNDEVSIPMNGEGDINGNCSDETCVTNDALTDNSNEASASPLCIQSENQESVDQNDPNQMPEDKQADNISPLKRNRSNSTATVKLENGNNEDVAKRIKMEPDDDNTHVQPDSSTATSSNINQGTQQSVRERCYYGHRCYRRNPQHLVQYSHPKDSDWGSGDKGECPHGATCSKNDQRHWDTHNHPPGTRRLPQLQGKKKRKQLVDTSDTSDDSITQLIVDGKRTRNLKQQDDFKFDESFSDFEPDPFGSDDSDEWEPCF
ncbi:unnamed protein product [Leptosia nina]|uniref:Aprataxin and PNK-like factor n=1 Tax=Leptosia nina TaxID=320188 RepID=A0AAV1JPV0_9NEOP